MKKLTRRDFTAAGIIDRISGWFTNLTGRDSDDAEYSEVEIPEQSDPIPDLDTFDNVPVPVYGPPEWFRSSNNEVEDVYGPPPGPFPNAQNDADGEGFDAGGNIPDLLYGPPEWFWAESNDNVEDYGPPPWEEDYDTEDNLSNTLYGPPLGIGFTAEDNEPDVVYGPPPVDWSGLF